MIPQLEEDMHVHSTYSDGKNSLEENIHNAERCGLRRLGCVDHVRHNTTWMKTFCAHIEKLRGITKLQLYVGVEAKLLSLDGGLDLPKDLSRVDYILAADHRLPLGQDLLTPGEVRTKVRRGELSAHRIADALVQAYLGVMQKHQKVIIAHPFSFLRQADISETHITFEQLRRLALRSLESGTQWEVSERWRCPSARTLEFLFHAGVRLRISTDSHQSSGIGRYDWVKKQLALTSVSI